MDPGARTARICLLALNLESFELIRSFSSHMTWSSTPAVLRSSASTAAGEAKVDALDISLLQIQDTLGNDFFFFFFTAGSKLQGLI